MQSNCVSKRPKKNEFSEIQHFLEILRPDEVLLPVRECEKRDGGFRPKSDQANREIHCFGTLGKLDFFKTLLSHFRNFENFIL